jgi:hypothetical protein
MIQKELLKLQNGQHGNSWRPYIMDSKSLDKFFEKAKEKKQHHARQAKT